MTQGGAGRVPSGPPAQQAPSRSTDYGFSTPQLSGNGSASAWPGTSAPAASTGYGAASADSTTGSLPSAHGDGAQATAPPAGPAVAAGAPNRARAARSRGPRRARLQLRHINPWTVLKFSCVLSVALFFVWLIVVGVLFGILDGAGIIGKINDTVTTIQGGAAQDPVTAGVVFGGAAIIGVVNIVLFIALSTIGSLVYNLCADLVGGIEITLSER
jgi:Transmembrane domain of unknown function (DUF3566)